MKEAREYLKTFTEQNVPTALSVILDQLYLLGLEHWWYVDEESSHWPTCGFNPSRIDCLRRFASSAMDCELIVLQEALTKL